MNPEELDAMAEDLCTRIYGCTTADLATAIPDHPAPLNTENPPPASDMAGDYPEENALKEFESMTAGMNPEEFEALFGEDYTRVHGYTTADLNTAIPDHSAPSNTEDPPGASEMPVEHSEQITVQEFLSMTAEELYATLEDASAPDYMDHDTFGF